MFNQNNKDINNNPDISALATSLEKLLKSHGGDIKDEIINVKNQAEEVLKKTKDKFNNSGNHISKLVKDTFNQIDDYIHLKPWYSIGISVMIGTVLGFMFLSRRQ
ncbi:MAG: DUF883 family protein [Pantoea sp. Brub]|nr:DUF883 family protein [Pantoea sp. Brub]